MGCPVASDNNIIIYIIIVNIINVEELTSREKRFSANQRTTRDALHVCNNDQVAFLWQCRSESMIMCDRNQLFKDGCR